VDGASCWGAECGAWDGDVRRSIGGTLRGQCSGGFSCGQSLHQVSGEGSSPDPLNERHADADGAGDPLHETENERGNCPNQDPSSVSRAIKNGESQKAPPPQLLTSAEGEGRDGSSGHGDLLVDREVLSDGLHRALDAALEMA
jgi:hypothetical protein